MNLVPEFPIRFDFLDTMDGGNLSLQVHPLKEYVKEQFGMAYTQDESYYIIDAGEDAFVYLGVNDNINPNEMIDELKTLAIRRSYFLMLINMPPNGMQKNMITFLIPAGTLHCSGKDCMVLEISATPIHIHF